MTAGRLAVSLGISPRQALADWSTQAAALVAEGVGRIWLIERDQVIPAAARQVS